MAKIKQNKKTYFPKGEYETPPMNIIEQHRIVEGVAKKLNKEALARQVAKELSKEVLTAECTQQITDEAVAGALMVMSNVLMNYWGKLNRRKTRLKNMYSIFREIFDAAENPNKTQLEAEAEFERQTGLKVIRDMVT